MDEHLKWMERAIELAAQAEAIGEVPVGALLVKQGQIIAESFNQSITLNDPCAHAEMLCLREAGKSLNNYRLIDTTLYVTLEPCPMCAGALVHARVNTLVFGASDPKTGAVGSVMDLARHPSLNHQISVIDGVLAERCSAQLSAFFKRRRQEKKQLKQIQSC